MSEYIYSSQGELLVNERGEISLPRREIVRCRDCKHSHEDRRCTSTGLVDVLVCESKQWSTSSLMPNHTVKPDGFCAWPERSEY